MTAPSVALALLLAGTGGPPPSGPAGPRPPGASVPTPAFAPDGTLWVAWLEGGHVYTASSPDRGRTFSSAARVSGAGESIDANGEARPKVAVDARGGVYVSYTRKGSRPFTGDIRFARRLPDGRFAEPVTVNDDGLPTGHRFDTLAVSPGGDVHLFWIDKRDLERARQAGRPYQGAALYHAVSRDGGRSFAPNRKVKDGICECCRLAVAWDGEAPVVLWRDIMEGGVRDHLVARLGGAGEPVLRRANDDGWQINGCPHHGPALDVDAAGTWHLAWFTGAGKRGPGTFYSRSADGGRTFSEPLRLGGEGAGRPAVAARGQDVWLAWKEAGQVAEPTAVYAQRSRDGGRTWGGPSQVARTQGASDHPLLVAQGGEVFLSWFTAVDGYRLVPLD